MVVFIYIFMCNYVCFLRTFRRLKTFVSEIHCLLEKTCNRSANFQSSSLHFVRNTLGKFMKSSLLPSSELHNRAGWLRSLAWVVYQPSRKSISDFQAVWTWGNIPHVKTYFLWETEQQLLLALLVAVAPYSSVSFRSSCLLVYCYSYPCLLYCPLL